MARSPRRAAGTARRAAASIAAGLAAALAIADPGVPARADGPRPREGDAIVRDVTGGVDGARLMAGVRIGRAEDDRTSSGCEWTASVPHDAHVGRQTEVTREEEGITFRLHDCDCPGEETTYHWLPETSVERIALDVADVMYAMVPAPIGRFAPPADRGTVKVDTWFWVDAAIWRPHSVTAWVPSPRGPVTVTTTAVPRRLELDPGDGALGAGRIVACPGPGTPWRPGDGDARESQCSHSWRRSSAMHPLGRFPARLAIVWEVSWKSNTGAGGRLADVRTSLPHFVRVREWQALVDG